jgi:hypothetical protein
MVALERSLNSSSCVVCHVQGKGKKGKKAKLDRQTTAEATEKEARAFVAGQTGWEPAPVPPERSLTALNSNPNTKA